MQLFSRGSTPRKLAIFHAVLVTFIIIIYIMHNSHVKAVVIGRWQEGNTSRGSIFDFDANGVVTSFGHETGPLPQDNYWNKLIGFYAIRWNTICIHHQKIIKYSEYGGDPYVPSEEVFYIKVLDDRHLLVTRPSQTVEDKYGVNNINLPVIVNVWKKVK